MARYEVINGKRVKMSEPREAAFSAQQAADTEYASILRWQLFREERNRRLAACDWTQVSDAPVHREAWAAYRQELRDLRQR
jgi:hypothetical protein